MSGFDGRISYEGSSARAKQLLGTAIKLANVQRENKNILGQAHSVRSYYLGGGAHVTIADLGHMRTMHIAAPEFPVPVFEIPEFPTEEGKGGPVIFDVLSGFVVNARISEITIDDPKTKKKKQVKVIGAFTPTFRTNKRYPSDQYRRQRLAVPENPIFLKPGDENEYSEHEHIRPSQYTGLMSEVVQLVLGLGKVIRPLASEAMSLKPLPPVGTSIVFPKETVPMATAFSTGFTPRVDWDYRSYKTHGVTIDADGIPWLIEIGTRGIHAMRLYLDPMTTTKEGKAAWIEVSPELKPFLDKFGGIPLGITMPVFEVFDAYKRAGEVVELMSQRDMRTFYSKIPIGTDTGWAFSPQGFEAHNICWDYGLDAVIRSYHYSTGINVYGERFKPWTPARSTLSTMYTQLFEINKCRRMAEEEAERILKIHERDGREEGDKAFDKSVVKPTLNASASLALLGMGKLYHPGKYDGLPQIKFPESIIGGCLSFDFAPSDTPKRHEGKFSGPMYVCFINGQLEVIGYAFDNTAKTEEELPPESTSTYEDCQGEGSWTNDSYEKGRMILHGNFYSNRWDFRKEMRTDNGSTHSECTAAKYGAWMNWLHVDSISQVFNVWTEIGFFADCQEWKKGGSYTTRGLSVAIPVWDRGAYYMAFADYAPISTHRTFGSSVVYKGRYEYDLTLYHPYFAWAGGSVACPPSEWIDKGGSPRCLQRWRCKIDNHGCFDEPDLHEDFFMTTCPVTPDGAYQWIYPEFKYVKPPSSYSTGEKTDEGHADSEIHFVNDTKHGEQITKKLFNTLEQGDGLDPWWWRFSPRKEGGIAYIGAARGCLGEQVTTAMRDFGGLGGYLFIGPEPMKTTEQSCFTGVIE